MKTIIALLLTVLSLHAQLVVDFVGGDDLSVGPGTAAYEFTTGSGITLRSLGVWASSGETLFSSHTVGIWDATSQTLLRSAVIQPNTSFKFGEFWYVNITPLTLLSGHEYVIGASYADNDFDFARGNATTVSTTLGVSFGDALLSNGTGFEFPGINVSGANLGFYGANAMTTVVPEPATIALVTGLALVLFSIVRKRGLFACLMVALAASGCVHGADVITNLPPAVEGILKLKSTEISTFEVRCPNCFTKQVLTATAVIQSGGYSTNYNNIPGSMASRTASFRCPVCLNDFTSPIKPDVFMPEFPAVPVRVEGKKVMHGEETLNKFTTPDGYEVTVIRRKIQTKK